jgi:hypothetical protein
MTERGKPQSPELRPALVEGMTGGPPREEG